MNYKSFNLGDWIGHISGVIEDETTLDGNEMRDLVEFLTTLNQESCEDCISRKAVKAYKYHRTMYPNFEDYVDMLPPVTPKTDVLDKIRAEIEFEIDHRTNMLCAEDVLAIIDKYRDLRRKNDRATKKRNDDLG